MSNPPAFLPGDGLLIVDPQNDFCPDGALAVCEGDLVMPILSAWAAAADRDGIPVFVSRDWHPRRTTHFKEFGGIWPVHCVMGTHGAEFHPDMHVPANAIVVSKGMGETEDAYSAFQARDDAGALLATLLAQRGIKRLYIGGLATDYCVKSTTLDALSNGYNITLVPDGMRAVNLGPNDGDEALAEMRSAGATTFD